MHVIGGDPGASTGLVCLDVPANWVLSHARWVGHLTLHPSESQKLSEPERDGNFSERLLEALTAWSPDVIILEEPLDAAGHWGMQQGGRRSGEHQQRATSFRLGVYYGALATGAYRTGVPVVSYPVRDHGKRKGWTGYAKRSTTLLGVTDLARRIGAPAELFEEKADGSYRLEHCLMALGVLAYHARLQRLPRSMGGAA